MLARRLQLIALAACAACRVPAPRGPEAIDLMKTVALLASPELKGRRAGSDGERRAGDHVIEQLRAMGLTPEVQDVPHANSRNVYARIRGTSDELIVVGAHLDHLGVRRGKLYAGADDDASGVAAVLSIARALAANPAVLRRSVVVVWFGAEEIGMVGSRHFVAAPPIPLFSPTEGRAVAMVNIDMIGRPLNDKPALRPLSYLAGIDRGGAVGLFGVRHYPGLRRIADDAFAAGGGEVVCPEDLPDPAAGLIERIAAGRGDSVSFEQRGIPALFFGDGESSDYHRPGDTVAALHPELLARTTASIGRVVVALSNAPAEAFARADQRPPVRKPMPGLYLSLGGGGGLRVDDGAHALYGAEASLVVLARSLVHAGVFADVTDASGGAPARASLGVQLGRRWYGLDAGYVAELGGERRRGFAVRPFATLGVVTLGVRAGTLDGSWFGELGLLVKVPLRLVTRARP